MRNIARTRSVLDVPLEPIDRSIPLPRNAAQSTLRRPAVRQDRSGTRFRAHRARHSQVPTLSSTRKCLVSACREIGISRARLAIDRGAPSPRRPSSPYPRRLAKRGEQIRGRLSPSAWFRTFSAWMFQPSVFDRSADSRSPSGSPSKPDSTISSRVSSPSGCKLEFDQSARRRFRIVGHFGSRSPFEREPMRRFDRGHPRQPRIALEAGVGHLAGRSLAGDERPVERNLEPASELAMIGHRPPHRVDRRADKDGLFDIDRS